MKVNHIRDDDSKGRHTTTHRQLIKVPSGGMIIDTPGMRELGIWDAEEGISGVFTDVEDLIAECKFSDCAHSNEPGCAIRKALANGQLTEARWNSYQQLKKESKFINDKAAYLRDARKWGKAISKQNRSSKRTK